VKSRKPLSGGPPKAAATRKAAFNPRKIITPIVILLPLYVSNSGPTVGTFLLSSRELGCQFLKRL
jgi:hypothetical protein